MSKSKKSVGAWLSDVFGTSHKAISENLSTEQYNQLVIDAGKFRESEESKQQDDEADETDEEETTDSEQTDPKNSSFESRLKALETGLVAAQNALKAEKKVSKGLTTKLSEAEIKLTETQTKLATSEEQKTKLRQAVNPLGDEDLTNKEDSTAGLTQADIEARKSYKANRSED